MVRTCNYLTNLSVSQYFTKELSPFLQKALVDYTLVSYLEPLTERAARTEHYSAATLRRPSRKHLRWHLMVALVLTLQILQRHARAVTISLSKPVHPQTDDLRGLEPPTSSTRRGALPTELQVTRRWIRLGTTVLNMYYRAYKCDLLRPAVNPTTYLIDCFRVGVPTITPIPGGN